MAPTYDAAVIGGGIVGLSAGMALSKKGHSVVVLEAKERLASGQTGRNSGVIHSGLYYKPGSLKARNCVQGRERMYRFCDQHGVPYKRCGKVVIATRQDEIPRLDELERRGRANGLKGLRRLSANEIQEYEPHAAGIDALHVPETGVVDFAQAAKAMAKIAQNNGAAVKRNARVLQCVRRSNRVVLETRSGKIEARAALNCAGLQADRVAQLCGEQPTARIVPFRGEYYELIPKRRGLVKTLIYPVPDPRFPFLGVHLTRRIDGAVEAGPNAVLALKRGGGSKFSFSAADAASALTYIGFWKMAFRYWRAGAEELRRSFSKTAFLTALRRLMPELNKEDIRPAESGVRAQALNRDGSLVDDFILLESNRIVHTLNAPSPAATASIAVGERLAELTAKQLEPK